MLTRAWPVLLLLSGCTHDFGSFEFAARDDAGARAPAPGGSSSGPTQPGGQRASDAGASSRATDSAVRGPRDSAGFPDGGDASLPDPACSAAWSATPPGSDRCSQCACDTCTASVLACLTQGSASEQKLCEAVLACSIKNGCGDDCYCNNNQCGKPDPDGNGPCVTEMNAAAGGSRDRVNQIIGADDPNEPLARATDALRCMFRAGRRASGPCQLTCP